MNFAYGAPCPFASELVDGDKCDCRTQKDSELVKVGTGQTCICKQHGGQCKWEDHGGLFYPCRRGTSYHVIADSTDEKLDSPQTTLEGGYMFMHNGAVPFISGSDIYDDKNVCKACERGMYYDGTDKKCKKSNFPMPCDSNQNADDDCTFSDGAQTAKCEDVGMKSNGYTVFNCIAKECKDGYLLELKSFNESNWVCKTTAEAQASCNGQCSNCDGDCMPKLYANPNNNDPDKAYIPGSGCECIRKGCKLEFKDADPIDDVYAFDFFVDGDHGDFYANHSKKTDLNSDKLKSLIKIDGKDVNIDIPDSSKVAQMQFRCKKFSNGSYFAFTCKDGYKAGKIVEDAPNGGAPFYDKCIDKPETKPEVPTDSATDDPEDLKKQQIQAAKNTVSDFIYKTDHSKKSAWKTAEGKFNTARLASDLTAGVVLGTVGGVVSGVVIKKKQLKKGYEALNCSIGGQKVADWGDSFRISFKR